VIGHPGEIERGLDLDIVPRRVLDRLALEVLVGLRWTGEPIAEEPGVEGPARMHMRLAEIGVAKRITLSPGARSGRKDQHTGACRDYLSGHLALPRVMANRYRACSDIIARLAGGLCEAAVRYAPSISDAWTLGTHSSRALIPGHVCAHCFEWWRRDPRRILLGKTPIHVATADAGQRFPALFRSEDTERPRAPP
jgi:hypothetical protein